MTNHTTQLVINKENNIVTAVTIVCTCYHRPVSTWTTFDENVSMGEVMIRRENHIEINHPSHLGHSNHTPHAVVVDVSDRPRPSVFHMIEMEPETYNASETRYVSSPVVTIKGKFKHQGIECGWKLFHSITGGQTQVYLVPLATIIDRGQIPSAPRRTVHIKDGDVIVIRHEAYIIKDDVRMSNPRLARA